MSETYLGRVADRRGVAEFFYEHEWNADEGRCECGWATPDSVEDSVDFDHAYHLADALRAEFDVQSRQFAVSGEAEAGK